MTLRLLVDARKLGDGGIGVYIENLVDGLLALKDRGVIDLSLSLLLSDAFFEAGNQSAFSTHFRTNGLGSVCQKAKLRWFEKAQFIREPAKKYSLQEYFLLPLRQRKVLESHDLFHSPHFTMPYFLGIPTVVTIHDIIHLSHPEKFYHRPVGHWMIRSALRRAAHVITVSDYSARHIQHLMRALKTPISVVPNAFRPALARRAADEVQQYLKREFVTREYCLYIGSERKHKGFDELLDAWQEFGKSCALPRIPDLIVVGKHFASSRDRVAEMNLDGVRFFGEVSIEKLALLYSGAGAVLVPSRAEGFGLPALEGMGAGVPVICASIPSLHEVCGDAGFYVDKGDGVPAGVKYARAITEVLSNGPVAAERISIGLRRAQEFSIENCAKKTWRVYEKVLGRSPAPFVDEPRSPSERQSHNA